MKHLITSFVLIFYFPILIIGQQTIRLNKDSKIDTIFVYFQQTDTIDNKLVNPHCTPQVQTP